MSNRRSVDYFVDGDTSATEDDMDADDVRGSQDQGKKNEDVRDLNFHIKETSNLHKRQQEYLERLEKEVGERPHSADSQSSFSSIASSVRQKRRRGNGRPPSGLDAGNSRAPSSTSKINRRRHDSREGGAGRSARRQGGNRRLERSGKQSPYATPVHRSRPNTANSTHSSRPGSSSRRGRTRERSPYSSHASSRHSSHTSRSSSRSSRHSYSRDSSVSSRSTSASVSARMRSGPSVYFLRPHTSRLTVYRNGSLTYSVRVIADSLQGILDKATKLLKLPFAARRLFDAQGTEYKTDTQCTELSMDEQVYVSLGEPFIDPVAQAAMGKTLTPSKSRTSKPAPSETQIFRVVVFMNGDGLNLQYIPLTTLSQRFFDACTNKFGSTMPISALYTIDGKRLTDINRVKPCDRQLEVILGRCLGPVWAATKTEAFNPAGVRQFLKRSVKQLKKVEKMGRSKKVGSDGNEEVGEENSNLKASIIFMNDKLEAITEKEDTGTTSLIPKISEDHRLNSLGSKKFFLYYNGQDTNEKGVVVHYNLRLPGSMELSALLDTCGRALGMNQPPKKIFLPDGTQIKRVAKLVDDEHPQSKLVISRGEAFIRLGLTIMQLVADEVEVIQPLERKPLFLERGPAMLEDLRSSYMLMYPRREEILENHDDIEVSERRLQAGEREIDPSLPLCCYANSSTPASRVANMRMSATQKPKKMHAFQKWVIGQVLEEDASVLGANTDIPWVFISNKYIKPLCLSASPLLMKTKKAVRGSQNSNEPEDKENSHHSNEDDSEENEEKKGEQEQEQEQEGEGEGEGEETQLSSKPTSDYLLEDAEEIIEPVDGYAIASFGMKSMLSIECLWCFKTDGTIVNAAFPGLCLTMNPVSHDDDDDDENENEKESNEVEAHLKQHEFVLQPKSGEKEVLRRQQWGLFHENLRYVGQWKLCRDVNSSSFWAKNNLIWPTTPMGAVNDELVWPLDVSFIAQVPWKSTQVADETGDGANNGEEMFQNTQNSLEMSGEFSSTIRTVRESTTEYMNSAASSAVPRIFVMRNGEESKGTIEVLLPSARTVLSYGESNPDKDFTKDTQRWFRQRLGPKWRAVLKEREVDNTMSIQRVKQEQLNALLDSCTRALGMTVAARNLFTEQGSRVRDIDHVHPNQTIIVTGTEEFKPSKKILARTPRIEDGISKLGDFLDTLQALASPQVVVFDHTQGILKTRVAVDIGLGNVDRTDFSQLEKTCTDLEDEEMLVAGWCLSEERWLMPIGGSSKCVTPASLQPGAKLSLEDMNPEDASQKWVLSNGYIESVMNPSLVIGLKEISGQHTEVVLTELLPEPFNAHQRLVFDNFSVGQPFLMQPFSTGNDLDIMATAGLQHEICTTSTISSSSPIRQVAVKIEGLHGPVCLPCSSLRKFRHKRTIGQLLEFSCVYCQHLRSVCEQNGVSGARACLLSKEMPLGAITSLTSIDAVESTISKWTRVQKEFETYKKMSERTSSIPEAPTAKLNSFKQLRLRVFPNGVIKPERSLVSVVPTASNPQDSVAMFLEELTEKMDLPVAARRLFTETGQEIKKTPYIPELIKDSDEDIAVVYVSTGEPFIDPSNTLAALHQRKKALKQDLVILKESIEEKKKEKKNLEKEVQKTNDQTKDLELHDVKEAMEEMKQQFKDSKVEYNNIRQKIRNMTATGVRKEYEHSDFYNRLSEPVRPIKRTYARRNGWSMEGGEVLCKGTNMPQLLGNCAMALGMRHASKLYNEEGKHIKSFDDITSGMKVIVSAGEKFIDVAAKLKAARKSHASFVG